MKPTLININVMLAERIYPLSIEPQDEATVRQAAKMINEKIKSYQQLYAAKDKQDFLAMIALNIGVDNIQKESNSVSSTKNEEHLVELNEIQSLLDSAFDIA